MNRLAHLAVLCAITTACSPGLPEGLDAVVTDSAGVMIVTAESLEGLPTRTPVGPILDLATSQDSAEASFSRVSAVMRWEDGRLIIADGTGRRLKVFGPDGAYLRTLTGSDGAEVEFSAITAIWPAGTNRLTVFDQRRRRVTTLSLDDNAAAQVADLSSANLRARPVGRLDTGDVLTRNLVFDVPETGFELAHVAVIRFGMDGEFVDTVGVWPTARMGRLGDPPLQLVSSPMFEPRLVTAAAGDRLLVSDCRSSEYRVIDPRSGVTQKVVRWPAEDLGVTEEDVVSYRARRLDGLPREQQRRTRRILDAMPVNPTLPACDQLRIDPEGRAWVRSFVRPGAVTQRWLVFDLDGRPLFGIEFPVATRILDLGSGQVTVIERDTLDVQRVRVYGIE